MSLFDNPVKQALHHEEDVAEFWFEQCLEARGKLNQYYYKCKALEEEVAPLRGYMERVEQSLEQRTRR
jgi:hypothetical protein